MSGVSKETYNLDFWKQNLDIAPTQEPPKKKRRRRANPVWDESQRLIDSWRSEAFPKKVVFLDYGDGYAIIDSSGNGNELISTGGDTDGVIPITKEVEIEKPEVIDAPDNVRRLAHARYHGYLGRKEKKRPVVKKLIIPKNEVTEAKAQEEIKIVHVEGSTINLYVGGNHDQAFPNPRVEDVNRQGLHRMAEIQRDCSRRAKSN